MADVTIIMAAYNEEKYVERALRSCLNQSVDDGYCDVILVDDGSIDATARIARGFEGVTVLSNEIQLGLPASLNRGIRAAHSRFVVRVDADDYIHQDFVRVLALFLELNLQMEAVACDYYTVDEREEHLEHVNCVERPIGCGIMFRKDKLIDLGLYDESFLMAEDLDLRLRFEKQWPMHRVELPLYRYRLHGANMTSDRSRYEHHLGRAIEKNSDEAL